MGAVIIRGVNIGSREQASSQARMTSVFTIDFAHFQHLCTVTWASRTAAALMRQERCPGLGS